MEPAPPARCPRCQIDLGDEPLIRHCSRCKGSWIAEETLHERAAAVQGGPPDLTWHKEARATLMCAICGQPMETIVVRDTPVDRCVQHGIWFDANELAHVLSPAAAVAMTAAAVQVSTHQAQEQAQTSSALDVAGEGIELAVDVADLALASEVVETGGGVFEVIIDGVGVVAEAVVDMIAGIFSALD
ncbi:MAG TPA: zf-TFIIB domain-containing protein [Kofleriaceae bacterium]|nr:zf-TFIIB domain-containing protein [Kofleriaceae bacterium]